MDEFSVSPIEGHITCVFKRHDYWNCEAFDKLLNEIVDDVIERVNDCDLTHFTFESQVHMYHDQVDSSGMCNEWEVVIEWDTDLPNPFTEEIERKIGFEDHDD